MSEATSDLVGGATRDLMAWGATLRADLTGVLDTKGVIEGAIQSALRELDAETKRRDPAARRSGGRLDLVPDSPAAAALISSLRQLERTSQQNAQAVQLAMTTLARLNQAMRDAAPAQGRVRMRLRGREGRAAAIAAAERLQSYQAWSYQHAVPDYLARSRAIAMQEPGDRNGWWEDLHRRTGWYVQAVAARRAPGARGESTVAIPSRDLALAARLARELPEVNAATEGAKDAVRPAFEALREKMVADDLSQMPLARVKDATSGRLRLGAIEASGYGTVQSILKTTPSRLMSLPGVGEQTAVQVHAAARQIANAVREDLRFRINLDPSDRLSTSLVRALCRWDKLNQVTVGLDDDIATYARGLAPVAESRPPDGGLTIFLPSVGASDLPRLVAGAVVWAERQGVWERLDRARQVMASGVIDDQEAWSDFSRRSADYYSLLGQLVDLNLGEEAEVGFLPAEIVEKVHAQPLDESLSRVSLRGYQSFGARFALVQRRVIIGDEMGLGKTIQAIAALAHIKATGATGMLLVVCPASVVVNWTREVAQRSTLRVHRLHGADREWALKRWARVGDVAVTTFETLRALDLRGLELAMVVVDEAHFLKNPATQRSQNVLALLTRAERALFLTGTPMENRVEEFKTLVGFLKPSLVSGLDGSYIAAERFRQKVAPAYLRRNQEDVLAELPELVVTDEWEEFSPADQAAYRRAVAEGNFMAMRRAAYTAGSRSAKLNRLMEIAAEASENGHKVIVFSYFRDVLETVQRSLGSRALGPLTGSVSAGKRQELVDAFTVANARAVLVSQIQAGGVGLNMQAGSVVIICEPQVKPTLEAQAIARAHRMGQVRGVQVHRLLTVDSVDQRMVEILDSKQQLFDEYVRRSDIANASPEALDISEASLAKTIVEQEQKRLALEAVAVMGDGRTTTGEGL